MAGRPSDYTQDIADEICEKLAYGQSLRSICEGSDSLPSARTVFRWLREHEEFCQQYARAKEESADSMVDDIVRIADNEEEDAQSRRVKIDARKWVASKLKPKKYGDKVHTEVTGADGGPIAVAWEVQPVVSGQAKDSDS